VGINLDIGLNPRSIQDPSVICGEREKLGREWFRTEAKLVGSRGYRFPWTTGADESLRLVLRLSWTFPNLFQCNTMRTVQCRNVMVCKSELARVACKEAYHSSPLGRKEI